MGFKRGVWKKEKDNSKEIIENVIRKIYKHENIEKEKKKKEKTKTKKKKEKLLERTSL